MRILGLDPGSIRFGVAIVEKRGREIDFIHGETINLSGREFNRRMEILWQRLGDVFSEFPVDHAAMEEGFLGKNVRSLCLLAMARGVAMGAMIARGIPFSMYSPRLIKQALTGYGNASKDQVQRMGERLFQTGRALKSDESDALAVAYCHALHLP